MSASATLLYNAGGYAGSEWRESLGVKVSGLRSPRNRAFLADLKDVRSWVKAQRDQGIRPCLVVSGISDYLGMWTLAKQLGNGIDYQIENEGDDASKSTLYDRPQEIGRRTRLMHDAVDGLGLDCRVILGAVQGIGVNGGGYRYLHAMLEGWGDGSPEAVSVNCYPAPHDVQNVATWMHQVRGVLASRDAQHAELWVTEWGIAGLSDMSEQQQGKVIRDMLRQFSAAGVTESLMWAADDANGFGFKDRAALKRVWNASIRAVS